MYTNFHHIRHACAHTLHNTHENIHHTKQVYILYIRHTLHQTYHTHRLIDTHMIMCYTHIMHILNTNTHYTYTIQHTLQFSYICPLHTKNHSYTTHNHTYHISKHLYTYIRHTIYQTHTTCIYTTCRHTHGHILHMYTICTFIKHKHMLNTHYNMQTHTGTHMQLHIKHASIHTSRFTGIHTIQHSRYTIDQAHIHRIYIHKHINIHMNT